MTTEKTEAPDEEKEEKKVMNKEDTKEETKEEKKDKKASVVELDLSQMTALVNDTIERMVSEGKLVRDEETGDIIDPEDEKKIAETIEKNKAMKKYKLESKGNKDKSDIDKNDKDGQ